MAKKSKGTTIDEYLKSLSEEERFNVKVLGIHASYNAKLGISSSLAQAAIDKIKEDAPLTTKGEKFTKTPEQQQAIAKMGGDGKLIRGYAKFKNWVTETGFDVISHQGTSNENFANALLTFRHNGKSKPIKLASKTADKYRKIYLSELK